MDEFVKIERRALLKASTGMLAGWVVAGSPLALIARGRAWAVEFSVLTSAEGAILLAATRTIMPHDKLEDAAYALVARAIDEDASKDEKVSGMLKAGMAELGRDFAAKPEAERVKILKEIEGSDFFKLLRLKTVQALYATPMAYAYFGYEGEAFSKGGYLLRGFNDLHWLPEVPEQDGGPLPVTK